MDILTIDFETYYAKDYGLRKLTTEEYIRDPRFEVIGVAIKKIGAELSSGNANAPLRLRTTLCSICLYLIGTLELSLKR
jgi:hypothetical protein